MQQNPEITLFLGEELSSASEAYDQGRQVFARLFTRWMDGNSWSHPVMTRLARGCTGGSEGWLHSSQIANLRHADTRNPGPRTFVAIERLNYYVWRYQNERKLIPGTESSNEYQTAVPILADDQPPGLGWFFEVFCGYRVPDSVLDPIKVPPDQAIRMSRALGRLLRRLMMDRGMDPVEDLSSVLSRYTTQESTSLERIRRVTLLTQPLTADELEAELQNLTALVASLGGPCSTEDDLLSQLRR